MNSAFSSRRRSSRCRSSRSSRRTPPSRTANTATWCTIRPPALLLPVGGGEHVAVANVPGHVLVPRAPAHGGHDPRRSVRCVSRGAGERTGHPPPPRVDVGGRDRKGPHVLLGRRRPNREVRGVRLAGREARRGLDHVAPGETAILSGVPGARGSDRLRRRGRHGRSRGQKAKASIISTARSCLTRNPRRDLPVSEQSIVLLVGGSSPAPPYPAYRSGRSGPLGCNSGTVRCILASSLTNHLYTHG